MATVLAAWATLSARHGAPVVAASAALGVAVLAGALVFDRPPAVVAAVVILGLSYGASRIGGNPDVGVALYGTGLLAVAELASWSLELRHGAGGGAGTRHRRWTRTGGLVAASAAVTTTVLAAGQLSLGGPGGEVVAGLGAIAVLALLVVLTRNVPSGR